MFVETNLVSGISDGELGLEDYIIYRRDRHQHFDFLKGGGILIAVSKNISSSIILNDYNLECEQLFIKLNFANKQIILGTAYIPPLSPSDIYECHVNTVETMYQNHHDHCDFLIVGDYNLPKTEWINGLDCDESLNIYCHHDDDLIRSNASILVNSFSYLNFNQMIKEHKDKGYTIDLCFTSLEFHEIKNQDCIEYLLPLDRHHDPALFSLNLSVTTFIEPTLPKKNYYKADFEKINASINDINWNTVLDCDDVTVNTDVFYSKLLSIIDNQVPDSCNNSKSTSTYPAWFSFDLIKYTIIKKKLHKIWISSNLLEDYIEFKKQRAVCLRRSR